MSRRSHLVTLPVAILAMFALFSPFSRLAAQSTAMLAGTVTDQSGAIVPGAKVVCRNTATDIELRTEANAGGLFRLPNVPVGKYDITVSHSGFENLVQKGIELLTEHTVDLNIVLHVGSSSQSVSVTATVPLVQTTTSDVQTTVDSRQMAELPLNGRNAFQLAVLTPGAIDTEAGTIPGQQENPGLAVNGMRPTETNWALDGGSYTNAQNGGAPTLPNPDTLQEFTALTSNFSAENRGGGAVVKLTTRSGTNQVHGTLFEFLRNDIFDARNFFDLSTQPYKQNQYGGTVGGPIRRNKLFYFGSLQGTNKRGSPNPKTLTEPTAAQHSGDFSATGHTIIDPKTGSPFPNDVIPQSRWDSIGAKLLTFMPLPNAGSNTVVLPTGASQDDYQYMIKVDYMISDKDHLSGRFFSDRNLYQRDNNSLAGLIGNDYYTNRAILIGETHTFGPAWIMENSFNYLHTFRTEDPVDPIGSMQDLGAQVQPAQPGVPKKIYVTLTGYSAITTPRGIRFDPYSLEYRNAVSRAVGSHFIRFGGSLRYNNDYMLNLGDETGNWTFNATSTGLSSIKNSGDAIGGLLLGLPQTFTQSVNSAYTFSNTLFALWVQDDWKVNRRLTFNIGLRNDPWMAPRLSDGLLLMGFVPGAHSTIAPRSPAGLLYSGDPGVPDTILHDHYLQLAPRFGLAWDLLGNGKTVVRGGYGIYRNSSEVFSLWRYWASAAPDSGATVTISAPPSTANPYQGFSGTVPFPYTPINKSQLAAYVFPQTSTLYAFDPSTKPGYTQSWNLTFEHQLRPDTAITIAYVANHFIRALANIKGNAAIYAPGATTATANLNSRRPYQGIGTMALVNDFDHGSYNSLQVGITKRPAHGLILQSTYTFSKALDLNSSDMLGGALGQAPRDPYNANLDKGPADFDATHSFKAMVLYDVPKLHIGNRLTRALVSGWQFNSIVSARTGFPFTCRSGVDNSLSGVGGDTCDQIQPDIARPAGANPIKEWFNTAAFTTNKIGTFGTAGRNTLRRPGVFTIDLATLKRVNITERLIGELRLEAFNALNHANLALWAASGTYTAQETVSSPNFGKLTAAQSPRLMQVSMKIRF